MATAANSPPDARNLGVFRKLLSEGLGRFFVTVCAGIIILITLLMIFLWLTKVSRLSAVLKLFR